MGQALNGKEMYLNSDELVLSDLTCKANKARRAIKATYRGQMYANELDVQMVLPTTALSQLAQKETEFQVDAIIQAGQMLKDGSTTPEFVKHALRSAIR